MAAGAPLTAQEELSAVERLPLRAARARVRASELRRGLDETLGPAVSWVLELVSGDFKWFHSRIS